MADYRPPRLTLDNIIAEVGWIVFQYLFRFRRRHAVPRQMLQVRCVPLEPVHLYLVRLATRFSHALLN